MAKAIRVEGPLGKFSQVGRPALLLLLLLL
jgi:hypothetical protein